MPSYADHPVTSRVKLLLLGDSGQGKTGGLASLANEGFKVHVLDVDRGLDVVSEYINPDKIGNLDYVPVNNKDAGAWKAVQEHLFKAWDGKEGENVYSWGAEDVLVIDSATFLCDMCHTSVLQDHKIAFDAAKYDRGYWNVTAKRFEALISNLMEEKVKCNIILTAHLRYLEDEKTGATQLAPSFLGRQLPSILPRYMNNMWKVEKDATKKELIYKTHAEGKLALKCTMPSVVKSEDKRSLGVLFRAMIDAASKKINSST